MVSFPTWVTANGAVNYLAKERDNYYQQDGSLGEWQGKLAEELGFKTGLVNEITKEQLENALWGKDAKGEQLVNARLDADGDRKRAAIDLTFSAPKSVSIAYELAKAKGNHELANQILSVQEKSVSMVLSKVENNLQTRTTLDGETSKVQSQGALIAKFNHEVARPVTDKDGTTYVDPSLHTHAIVMNVAKLENGEHRAIETQKIFDGYMDWGQQYRSEFAAGLKDIGFELMVTDPKKGFYEIVLGDVDTTVKAVDEYSKRSEQMEEKVAELRKQYPNKSESELKQLAAHQSREWKGDIDRDKVLKDNLERAESLGIDVNKILTTSKANALSPEQQLEKAQIALNNALQAITDSKSVFTKDNILSTAGKLSLKDGIGLEMLEKAISLQEKEKGDNKLINFKEELYTTKEIINKERDLLDTLQSDRTVKADMSKTYASQEVDRYSNLKEDKTGFGLTDGQKDAAKAILSDDKPFVLIQGDAGTGKTTMLKAVNELKNDDTKIIGLSYTGKAASEIEKATQKDKEADSQKVNLSKESFEQSGIKSSTIASFLGGIERMTDEDKSEFKNSKLIIDEASMLGLKDAHKLNEFAKETGSQLVLIGDIKQFVAINAGSPFRLLQEHGAEVTQMSEVLRQEKFIKDEHGKDTKEINPLWQSVQHINKFESEKTFDVLDKAGKIEVVSDGSMIEKAKEKYLNSNDIKNTEIMTLDKDIYRNNLILTNTNITKDELNFEIRSDLQKMNILSQDDFNIKVRESTRLLPTDRYIADNYQKGHSLFLQDNIANLKKGSEFEIVGVNSKNNTLTLLDKESKSHIINLDTYGASIQSYETKEKSFAMGEKIVFEKNDKKLGVNNGNTAIIQNIDDKGNITALLEDNKTLTFNTKDYNYFNHGYAVTNYKAQGQTTQNVIALMDSKAQNFNSFYVGLTRAQKDISILTDDKETLKDLISAEQIKSNYHTNDKDEKKFEEQRENIKNARVERAVIKQEAEKEKTKDEQQSQKTRPGSYKSNEIVLDYKTTNHALAQLDNALKSNNTREAAKIFNSVKSNLDDNTFERYENKIDKIAHQKQRSNYTKITKDEILELSKQTVQELRTEHPGAVLNALGIDYKESSKRITFKMGRELTSANMYIAKDGDWKYHRFSSGASGSIETVVMEHLGTSYKEALNFAVNAAGTKDHVAERFDEIKRESEPKKPFEIKEEHQRIIEEKKQANKELAKESDSNSKVVSVKEITSDDKQAIEFLQNRGIKEVPENFYRITGEFTASNGNTYKNEGVGVLTGNMKDVDLNNIDLDKVGADIHLFNRVELRDGGTLKTQSFGNKDITIINDKDDNSNVAIFESKMDYAAAASQHPEKFEDTTSIIANGTGNYHKVADELRENHENKDVTFYNQNDAPGELFVKQVAEEAELKEFNYISYEKDEEKQDINDLVKNDVDLEDRIKEDRTIEDFEKEAIDKELDKDDIKSSDEVEKDDKSDSKDDRTKDDENDKSDDKSDDKEIEKEQQKEEIEHER
ncbi:MobF family relaxase [Arcobacter sp. FWKO B]|uniref:MobF family relaxase n=1 Tax=Arcobacter sp. FWKO B TaxID=2593672 RepID=UPI0018A458E7|nr:MobF family relaxase [Arcobacter sp. FWKO B]QOG13027.1 AAA family ATPase [Arcobacter sp. FWKO B]